MSGVRTGNQHGRELIRWAEERGWNVTITGGNHLRFSHPLVGTPVYAPLTPRVCGGHLER